MTNKQEFNAGHNQAKSSVSMDGFTLSIDKPQLHGKKLGQIGRSICGRLPLR